MRIGIVINSSWNIHNFRLGLIESFIKSGHQVVTIAPNDGCVEILKAKGCEFYPLDMSCKGSNPLQDFSLTKQLIRVYRKTKIDVVLHYTIKPNIYGTLATKVLGIPAINNVTGLGTVFLRNNLTTKVAKMLYKFAFQYPHTIFFQNNDDRQLFINQGLVNRNITDLLPGSGVNLQQFQPVPNSTKNKMFTFLVIARVLYDKGIVEYIEAIRSLKSKNINAKFQLLGKIETDRNLGISRKQLARWEKEGLIEYLGTTDDVRGMIQQSDCMVLPSYREGTPRTLLEAAGMGKPIITTDVPGCRETVEHGYNGLLCESKNPEDLADRMHQVYMMNERNLKIMGNNSRKLAVSKFDERIVIQKYHRAVNRVAEEKGNRLPFPVPSITIKEPQLTPIYVYPYIKENGVLGN